MPAQANVFEAVETSQTEQLRQYLKNGRGQQGLVSHAALNQQVSMLFDAFRYGYTPFEPHIYPSALLSANPEVLKTLAIHGLDFSYSALEPVLPTVLPVLKTLYQENKKAVIDLLLRWDPRWKASLPEITGTPPEHTLQAQREALKKQLQALPEEALPALTPVYKISNVSQAVPAMIQAASMNNVQALEDWLRAGADVNEKDYLGKTPLMHAAENGHLEAVEWLIAHQSKIDALSRRGESALALARAAGHQEIIERLQKAGALR